MTDWQPIETAPKDETIILYGYNVQGQFAPGGAYKRWFVTVGDLNDYGTADDLLKPGSDHVHGGEMEHPTHWQPLPSPPSAA